ncbi:MAG: SUMF1/EgtB/PvdO family nonheme iron enzyme, partial [Chloroflexota bacterium]
DWYLDTYYQDSPSKNPLGPDAGISRVLRGGSWNSYVFDTRSSVRYVTTPVYFSYVIGFRCARPAQ